MDMKKLFKDLKRGADIIIGTPGKLWDLVQVGAPIAAARLLHE